MAQPTSSGPSSTTLEKVMRLLIPAGLIFGGIKLFNAFAPELIMLLKNIYWVLGLGVPLAVLTLYVIANPMLIWMSYKNLCKKLTGLIIKIDPLSFMDRYADLLDEKLKNLNVTIEVLKGKKIKLDRKMKELEEAIDSDLKLGQAAVKQKNNSAASIFGTQVQGNRETLKMLLPLLTRVNKSLDFLYVLSENWTTANKKLRFEIDRKRSEFEIIKETAKGLRSADDFINSDSEAAQIYGQSLKALEESVTQKMGYIEEFERKSKGLLDGMNIEKQANQDEGLAVLEEYMKNGALEMPEDFSAASLEAPRFSPQAVKINGSGQAMKKFDLLKK